MSEELRELPEGWELTTLGKLGEWSSGGTPSRRNTEYYGGLIPWVKTGDLPDDFIKNIKETITQEGLVNSSAKLFPHGSLVVAMYGATIGKLGILDKPAATNQACAVLISRGITTALIPYLFYYLLSSREDLRMIGQGGAQPNISQAIIKEYSCPLPPLNEQKRIVAKIEELNDRTQKAKEALDSIPQLCDRFRQSVLAAAFRGDLTADWREQNPDVEPASVLLERIRRDRRQRWEESELIKMQAKGKLPKDENWKDKYQEPKEIHTSHLPELPNKWSWVRAEEVCDFITKGTTPSSNEMFEQAGDVPFIKVYNLTFDGKLDFSVNPTFIDKVTHDSKLARSKVFPGDVLMNIVGPPLGKVSIVPDNQPEWNINQAIVVYRPIKGIYNRFLCYYLLSSECLFFATSMAKATAGQFNLTLEICRDLPLPIPPILEQEKIVAQIDNLFNAADIINQQVEKIKFKQEKLNQSILAKAFRGRANASKY
ncbi:restriction modification system DNA specificity subunit [Anabaenopsis circularis NIES-21]|uniref:Restriction modification system DNA specificity subunit n=1 Tax=Anabaenopsis circularis NIES-21 TaxID=1085406 RepID=A0A1Z4GB00_9CYAN|nr:restriction modification system DNA specificity subunit [Anabaenopsis circularis NIES-21]